jgi:hypothetical protein
MGTGQLETAPAGGVVEAPPRVCQWEACQEPATCEAKWRREDPPYGITFDHASYCENHLYVAESYGASGVRK